MLGTFDDQGIAIEQRRQLHVRIARSRRRLSQQSARLIGGGFLPRTWRQQIQDHPVVALLTAAGVGALLAQIGSRNGAASKAGDWLAKRFVGGSWPSIMKHVERILSARDVAGQLDPEQQDA